MVGLGNIGTTSFWHWHRQTHSAKWLLVGVCVCVCKCLSCSLAHNRIAFQYINHFSLLVSLTLFGRRHCIASHLQLCVGVPLSPMYNKCACLVRLSRGVNASNALRLRFASVRDPNRMRVFWLANFFLPNSPMQTCFCLPIRYIPEPCTAVHWTHVYVCMLFPSLPHICPVTIKSCQLNAIMRDTGTTVCVCAIHCTLQPADTLLT